MYLLSKLLPLFVMPLGIALMLMTWGVLRQKKRPALLGLAILMFASQPYVAYGLLRAAEGWAERPAVATLPTADAIVVLSVGRRVAPGPDRVSEWGDANRFFGGLQVFEAGKAPRLVFTRASNPFEPPGTSEGEVLANVAETMRVPREAMILTGPVLNTADEARETREALRAVGLGTPSIILVTSAFHMPRAKRLFESAGHVVIPFPVDFSFSEDGEFTILDVIPSVGALSQSHAALREFYGRAFNWLRSL